MKRWWVRRLCTVLFLRDGLVELATKDRSFLATRVFLTVCAYTKNGATSDFPRVSAYRVSSTDIFPFHIRQMNVKLSCAVTYARHRARTRMRALGACAFSLTVRQNIRRDDNVLQPYTERYAMQKREDDARACNWRAMFVLLHV